MEVSADPFPIHPDGETMQVPVEVADVDAAYEPPTDEELQWTVELIGWKITIFWDGDNAYYPGLVTRYDEAKGKFLVLYDSEDSGREYLEDLHNAEWKINRAAGKIEPPKIDLEPYDSSINYEQPALLESEEQQNIPDGASKTRKSHISSAKPPSYAIMVVDAVLNLNEKNGSSLNAIRKYILTNYNVSQKQTASFNSLTLKAVNKAVAANELEKVKHSFRLTVAEKERRKEAERKALGLSALAEMRATSGSSGRRRSAVFTVDDFLTETSNSVSGRNRSLRKELLDFRMKRDIFLRRRLSLLKAFLPEKDYFSRKDREEDEKREMRKAKKLLEGKPGASATLTLLNVNMEELEEAPMLPENIVDITVEEVAAPSGPAFNGELGAEGKKDMSSGENLEVNGEAEQKEGEKGASSILDESTILTSTLSEVETVEMPRMLKATLHDHQVVGISWMVHMYLHGMPMILGDQMGLGKTLQTIGFLTYLHEKLNKKGPHLVVVPLSVLSNWLSEIERFCPSFRAVRFHGPKVERERIKSEELNDLSEFDIVVTTYEILVSEAGYFRHKFVWTTVIIDEGHRLKNEKSQLSEKIRGIPCVCKVILTGTPLQNNLHELWAMFYYLAPDIFSSSEPFDEGFDLTRGVIDNEILRKARKLLAVFMLRRLKDMVSIKLPSRKEVTLLVPLTEEQSDLYRQVLCGLDVGTIEVVMNTKEKPMSRSVSYVDNTQPLAITTSSEEKAVEEENMMELETAAPAKESSGMNDSDWRKLMNLLLQLRKICNHTYLLPHVAPEPYEVTEEIVKGSGKLLMLDRMLPALRADGHRVLIFSQFTSMLDLLEDYCELREYPFVRLDGETNRVKRRLDVRRFNSPHSNIFIFLISTRAGGLGLNLASADTVILYDSDWNPQVDLQAMERAHRIGQVKPVRVFRLVCRGSVEERMVSRAEKKLFLNAMVAEMDPDEELAEGGEEVNIMQALGIGGTAMSKSELASLIRFGANAVVDSDNNGSESQISDEDLYRLLERQGRDLPHELSHSSEGMQIDEVLSEKKELEEDTFEKAQALLRDRMEKLQEVDLRQLGSVVYAKKKPERKSGIMAIFDNENILDGKRQRKERIVKVDGKGTGYGGAVPMLADQLEEAAAEQKGEEPEEKVKSRGRQWVHRTFCTLCGMNVLPEHMTKCAHCPFIFHTGCADNAYLIAKGSGMFICTHHRCGACDRSTSSAGGLLFRCTGCLSAYCEDCLPQDEIESLGRCRALEAFNYHSKQAYYIKCPSCCEREGCKPMGVLANIRSNISENDTTKVSENAEKEGDEGVEGNLDGGSADDGAEDWISLPTMSLRIQWHLVPDPPPKKSPKKKGGKKRKQARKSGGKAVIEEESEEEEDDEDEQKRKKGKMVHVSADDLGAVHIPENCTLAQGLDIVLQHDALKLLCSVTQPSLDPTEDFTSVFNKVEAGRYRSPALFVADLRYAIDGRVVKKMQSLVKGQENGQEMREKIAQCTALLMDFLQNELEPALTL